MRLIFILYTILMMSCYSVISEYSESEEILDYKFYIDEGWKSFEAVNLSDTLLVDEHGDYYILALEFFNVAIQAIDTEFSSQQFTGPYYQAYNGIGWTQLYYAGQFLNDNHNQINLYWDINWCCSIICWGRRGNLNCTIIDLFWYF